MKDVSLRNDMSEFTLFILVVLYGEVRWYFVRK